MIISEEDVLCRLFTRHLIQTIHFFGLFDALQQLFTKRYRAHHCCLNLRWCFRLNSRTDEFGWGFVLFHITIFYRFLELCSECTDLLNFLLD